MNTTKSPNKQHVACAPGREAKVYLYMYVSEDKHLPGGYIVYTVRSTRRISVQTSRLNVKCTFKAAVSQIFTEFRLKILFHQQF